MKSSEYWKKREADALKNYQKDVDKKTVYFDQKGKALKEKAGAAEIAEAYVYRVKLQFLSTAEPGQ